MSIKNILDSLNESQHKAATHEGGHALVLAGAGCGKTKTIMARTAYLISKGVPPSRIKILTFTRRSASEIVERVKSHLGPQAEGLNASTFHTWCMGLIRRAPALFGSTGFSIIDRDDQLQLFRSLRGQSDAKLPTAATMLDLYSFARNTGMSLSECIRKQNPEYEFLKPDIAAVMKQYEQRKTDRNYLDYDDILDVVASQIKANPVALNWVASQYAELLIDEMQDTNPLQWRLVEPLKDHMRLFCVGDDAQSIYGFRGADFANIHSFAQRVPGAVIFKLEQNYRSTQEILDVSNWLLSESPIQYDKWLVAARGSGTKPRLITFTNEFEEANWIVEDIKERHDVHGAKWREQMVLTRTAHAARATEAALLAAEVPYRFIGGTKLMESAHVRDMLSLLRIVANHRDEIGWIRFLTLFPKVGEKGAAKFVEKALGASNLDGVMSISTDDTKIPPSALQMVKQVWSVTAGVSAAVRTAVAALLPILSSKYENQGWDKRKRDFKMVEKLAEKHVSVMSFIEEYMLDPVYTSEVDKLIENDAVTVITVHSAKGTECEVCYAINVAPGSYPSSRSRGDEAEVEEDRRVLYVALTRAKNELIITRPTRTLWAAQDRADGEDTYFLSDLPDGLVVDEIFDRRGESAAATYRDIKPAAMIRTGVNFD